MKPTTTLRKIARLKNRIKVIQGGQGAGKTFAILLLLINHANSKKDKEIIVAGAELTKMRLTVIKDFVKIMKGLGLYEQSRHLAGTLYRFPSGSFIKFIGADKEDIGKGLRSDIVFINECNRISFETYRELTSRAKWVFLDYNPNASFWVDEEVLNRDGVDFLKLTYKDNEFLSPTEIAEIEGYRERGYYPDGTIKNEYWANKWRVYGLGEQGKIEGAIFQNWKTGEFPEHLPFMYGMDFGTRDPTTLIKVAFDKKEKRLYVEEIVYRPLTPEKLTNVLSQIVDKKNLIIADNHQKGVILDLQANGFNVLPCVKSNIVEGLSFLQDYEIIITPESSNVINEFLNYIWLDRKGEVPIETNNHAIDAIRYAEHYYRHVGSHR